MEQKAMMRRLMLSILAVMMVMLAGCQAKDKEPAIPTNEACIEYETYDESEHSEAVLKKATIKCGTTTWVIHDVISDGVMYRGTILCSEEEKYRTNVENIAFNISGEEAKFLKRSIEGCEFIDAYNAKFNFSFMLDEPIDTITDNPMVELVITNMSGQSEGLNLYVGKAPRISFDSGKAKGMLSPYGIIIEGPDEAVPDSKAEVTVVSEDGEHKYTVNGTVRYAMNTGSSMYKSVFYWDEHIDVEKIEKVLFDGVCVYAK